MQRDFILRKARGSERYISRTSISCFAYPLPLHEHTQDLTCLVLGVAEELLVALEEVIVEGVEGRDSYSKMGEYNWSNDYSVQGDDFPSYRGMLTNSFLRLPPSVSHRLPVDGDREYLAGQCKKQFHEAAAY